MKKTLIILTVFFFVKQLPAQVSIQNLRCEMLVNPLGIDAKEPRLSWQLSSNQRNVQQTAYEIIVTSNK
jgi:alpha-L-rhamnosidase